MWLFEHDSSHIWQIGLINPPRMDFFDLIWSMFRGKNWLNAHFQHGGYLNQVRVVCRMDEKTF
jgi:hypothetical protein